MCPNGYDEVATAVLPAFTVLLASRFDITWGGLLGCIAVYSVIVAFLVGLVALWIRTMKSGRGDTGAEEQRPTRDEHDA